MHAPPLTCDLAWADLGARTLVTARGPDAGRFVEGFTTASVAGLEPGEGAETFFTDARGWVLALATALRVDEGLLLDAAPGLGPRLREHLEHYHIRERVELVDLSADHAAVLVTGSEAREWLTTQAATPPARLHHHAVAILGGVPVRIAHLDLWTGCDWLVQCTAADHARLGAWLGTEIGPAAEQSAVEAARIIRGTPHPADIREKTLPQELGRDARAISFTKGCYLGQETVARLDALGHVNRRLAVVVVAGEVRPATEVRCSGEPCGLLTSAAPAPHLGGTVALGLLSTKLPAGVALTVDGMTARSLQEVS
jgi:folate-binding protein YgfZ